MLFILLKCTNTSTVIRLILLHCVTRNAKFYCFLLKYAISTGLQHKHDHGGVIFHLFMLKYRKSALTLMMSKHHFCTETTTNCAFVQTKSRKGTIQYISPRHVQKRNTAPVSQHCTRFQWPCRVPVIAHIPVTDLCLSSLLKKSNHQILKVCLR